MKAIAWLLVCISLVSCSSDDEADDATSDEPGRGLCEALVERLRDCDLLSEGEVRCDDPTQERDVCLFECAREATCDDLWGSVCPDGELIDLGNAAVSEETSECMRDCADRQGSFTCEDGDLVPEALRCDGDDDCGDGSDEVDCEGRLFVCGNGRGLPASYRCDGFADCGDDSDEAGCPMFRCADGSGEVAQALRCDYRSDCEDGSDEDGCASPQCD